MRDSMPPVRGRELKLTYPCSITNPSPDAPCAGARIETLEFTEVYNSDGDAPCAGARIET